MTTKADIIIDAATTVFTAYGYNSPSIDKICETAKVSKMTFYRHFEDKDKLIDAVLTKKHQQFIDAIQAITKTSPTAKEQLWGIFQYYHAWFEQENFNGCMFSRALFETGNTNPKIKLLNYAFRTEMLSELQAILRSVLKPEAAERISTAILMLIDGAIIAQASNNHKMQEYPPITTAWQAVKALIYAEGGQL